MWVVDRIEGDHAVIRADDREETFDIPLAVLPPGTAEGDVITVAREDDTERLDQVSAQMEALAADDSGDDFNI